jgi:hypothetical protein
MTSPAPKKAHIRRKIQLQDLNATLICSVALLFFSAFSYGFSDQSFASTQATAAFKKQFGDYSPKTKTYALPALYLSLLNSLKAGTQLVGKEPPFVLIHSLKYLTNGHRRHYWKLDQQALWQKMVYFRYEHICFGKRLGHCVRDQSSANACGQEYPLYEYA